MNNFRQGSRPRGGRRDSFRRDSDNRGSGRATLYDAICDECGKDCKVPFKPSGNKPIYCSDCFEKREGRSERSGQRDFRGGRDNRDGGGSDRAHRELVGKVADLNAKMDRIIELLTPRQEEVKEVVKPRVSRAKKSEN